MLTHIDRSSYRMQRFWTNIRRNLRNKDIFSKDSSDIGKTPLISMEIETGDSPPVCQRPYNLPLKHIDWVQKELDTLKKAGVITRSVLPWASPIVIVPKRTVPGEPPKKRLCYVQHSYLMSLLSPVKHPKLQRCYVICKYCIEEVFNIVKIEGLIFVLYTKKRGGTLYYLVYMYLYVFIGRSRGCTWCTHPLRVPILSFWHTKFSKHNHLRSPHPLLWGPRPPYGKSWICHWYLYV